LAHKAGLPSVIGTLTDVGAVVSFFGCILACVTAAARVLFLMGRQGALHALLGEAHETNQTPHRAVLLSSVAAFLPAGIMTLRGVGVFEIYGLLGTLATFGFVTAYIMIALAAPVFLKAQGRLTFPALSVSILAVLSMGAALLGSVYPVPPGAYALLPYVYVALLAAGLTWSLVWSTRTPVLVEESS
jgi:amino acid transporter